MTTVTLIIILAVLQFMALSFLVGPARVTYNVEAPKTTGHEEWERRFRVHQNTMEQLVAFIPAIWLCATYANVTLAVVLGLIYLLGRSHYAYSYIKDPKLRAPGMIASFFPTFAMALAALGGILLDLIG